MDEPTPTTEGTPVPNDAPPPAISIRRQLAVAPTVAAGAIHAAASVPHYVDSAALGIGFTVTGLLQLAVAAAVVVLRGRRRVAAALTLAAIQAPPSACVCCHAPPACRRRRQRRPPTPPPTAQEPQPEAMGDGHAHAPDECH